MVVRFWRSATFHESNALGNGRAIGNASATINRFNSSSTQYIASQPRMLVSYPRRGRGVGLLLRQTNYVPVVPIAATPGNLHKPGLSATIRNAPFKLLTTPIRSRVGPFAPRGGGRKRGQSIGRNTNKNVRVATTYQPRSTNLVPSCMGINRRRIPERRGITRDNVSVQPEIDCTKPYDFETANAELEAELAKINLNVDAVSVATTRHDSVKEESLDKRSVSSATSRTILTAATNENGASGDSSSAVVISTVRNNVDAHTTESQNPLESTGTLAKGEYYVREKCFFDQISRSGGGAKGPTGFQGGRGKCGYSGNTKYPPGSFTQGLLPNASSNAVGVNSPSAARRERKLNLETFGPMAARTLVSRRRPTGSVPRDFLVSASA
ncbi:unnamed protein product [Heterobilharzia americana]|nr:unnamed protein product [Heterobilharzia americana]